MGSGSVLRYHLLSDIEAWGVGLDIQSYAAIRKLLFDNLPQARREDCLRRFRYVRMDMAKLLYRNVRAICRQHL